MSCLFNSIGYHVNASGDTVRATICDYMEQHKDEMHKDMALSHWIGHQQQMEGEEVDAQAYIKRMRQRHIWGGAMELAVATKVYRSDIDVVNGTGKTIASFKWVDNGTSTSKMVVQWTGAHYEPVR